MIMTNQHYPCLQYIKQYMCFVLIFSRNCDITYLSEPFHIVSYDLRVRTLQFPDDLKALVELGEHVHHGAGEQSVF